MCSSESVPSLVRALTVAGDPARLLTTRTPAEPDLAARWAGLALTAYPVRGARVPVVAPLRYAPGLARAVRAAAGDVDVVHTHGLWQYPGLAAARAAVRGGARLVISPRGMLDPPALVYGRAKKRIMFALAQARALEAAALFHVTAASELENVRSFGLTQPVAVVPNGVDVPPLAALPARVDDPSRERTVLSLGRIHPKKGLDRLIAAWAAVEPHAPGWRLRIAGPAEHGHDGEISALAARLGLSSVTVEGAIYGADKAAAYCAADLFVLATRSENFGLTVAEALAHEVPVIVTHGAPWAAVEAERCGAWVAPEALADALRGAIGKSDAERQADGARGRAFVARAFSWDAIAASLAEAYRFAVVGGAVPAAVDVCRPGSGRARLRARWPSEDAVGVLADAPAPLPGPSATDLSQTGIRS